MVAGVKRVKAHDEGPLYYVKLVLVSLEQLGEALIWVDEFEGIIPLP